MRNIDGRFSLQDRGGVSDLAAVALEADALHRLADHLGVAHVVRHQRRRLVHVVQRSDRARLRKTPRGPRQDIFKMSPQAADAEAEAQEVVLLE